MSRSGGGIASRGASSAGTVEVYFATEAVGVPTLGKEGDCCYVTNDGTKEGKLISRYIHDGTEWVELEKYRVPMFVWNIDHAYFKDEVCIKNNVQYQANNDIPSNTAFSVGTAGATWKQLQFEPVTSSFMQAIATATQTNVAVGTVIIFHSVAQQSGTDISCNTTTGEFTLKANRTYKLTGIIGWTNGSWSEFQWHNGTSYFGSVAHHEPATSTGGVMGTGVSIAYITPSVDTVVTYKLQRGGTTTVNDANGAKATAIIEVVAAAMPPTTGTVTKALGLYVNHNISGVNTDITGMTITSNKGITYANGVISLEAGITYEILTLLDYDSRSGTNTIGDIFLLWVDATTNAAITEGGSNSLSINYAGSLSRNGGHVFQYTPTANKNIKLRVSYSPGTSQVNGTITVKQLGHSNVSQYVGALTNEYNVNNSYPQGTIVVKDNTLYQANGVIPAGTVFTVGLTGSTWRKVNNEPRIVGKVNAGVAVTLGNIQARMAASGNRSLELATVSGSFVCVLQSHNLYGTKKTGSRLEGTLTTTFGYVQIGANFLQHGNIQQVYIMNETTGESYEIKLIVGYGYNNNIIEIRRIY